MERKYYSDGEGKPPIWIRPILDKKEMTDIEFFYFMDMLDFCICRENGRSALST